MKKIIFVDDDPSVQEIIKLIFLPAEYDLTVFSQGEPLMNNEFNVPDIFLLDKQLSGFDGLDICRFLKSQPSTSHVPVIIVTATPGIQSMAAEAGADAVVEKPFSVKSLRELIEQFTEKIRPPQILSQDETPAGTVS
jgi:CheY-like chemotaxis protein